MDITDIFSIRWKSLLSGQSLETYPPAELNRKLSEADSGWADILEFFDSPSDNFMYYESVHQKILLQKSM